MSDYIRLHNVRIAYFSGTGGTALAAEQLTEVLMKNRISVEKTEISIRKEPDNGKGDMLILLYPVYALNAPKPVYDFIDGFSDVNDIPAAVLRFRAAAILRPIPRAACTV